MVDTTAVYNPLSDDGGDVVELSMASFRGSSAPADVRGVQIDLANVNYSVLVGKGKDQYWRNLLFQVDLHIDAGELVALMGPSGAGKSTLLDVIANRKREGMWSGDMLFNQQPHSPMFARECAYVLQDDVHIPVLTVRETIRYACWVKMTEGTTEAAREARVNQLVKMLGLEKVADSQVGDKEEFRGISGGQMKRLSIAVEIAHLPELIFLDEPTSGLDSSISLEVMTAVKALADQGRTCVTTIHQPSPEVFGLFDRCILVSAGRVVYTGPADEIVDYFQRPPLNFTIKSDELATINPAEYALEICGGTRYAEGENKPTQAPELAKAFAESSFYKPPQRDSSAGFVPPPPKFTSTYATSLKTQTQMLLQRGWTSRIRDTKDLKAQAIKVTGAGLLIGLPMYGVANISSPLFDSYGIPKPDVANCSSLLFMVMMYNLMNNQQAITKLCYMQTIYRREIRSNAYSTAPYWISSALCEQPMIFAGHVVATSLFYLLGGFPEDFGYFIFFFTILYLTNLNSYFMAQIIAAVTQNAALAFAVFPLSFMLLNRFSGFGLAVDDVSDMWSWAPYIAYSRWSFEAITINHFEDFGVEGDKVIESFGFGDMDKSNSIWILLVNMGAFVVFLYWALLEPKSKLKKILSTDSSQSVVLQGMEGLTETLIGDADVVRAKSDYDILPGKSTYTVDWYRANTGEIQLSRGCKVMFRDLCYTVPKSSGKSQFPLISAIKKCLKGPGKSGGYMSMDSGASPLDMDSSTETPILRGVSGRAQPGEMVALMGASGAGKSTLLDVIAGRKNSGNISGDLLFDGQPCFMTTSYGDDDDGRARPVSNMLSAHYKTSIPATEAGRSRGYQATRYAYVMQDNVHIGELTVRETLNFAAKLRLDQRLFNPAALEKRIQKVMDMLGLDEHADTLVGNHEIRGISGGQMKRLSIGVEIINLPELIFLDEPTTGLDSNISYEVISAVRNLANQNRTVIATIHQPSPDTFALFDKLLVLAEGRVIFFGPRRDCVNFFTQSPYEFSYFGNNPADFVVAVAGGFINPGNMEYVKDKSRGSVPGEELSDFYADSRLSLGFRENAKAIILTDLAQSTISTRPSEEMGRGADRSSALFADFSTAVHSQTKTKDLKSDGYGFSLMETEKLYANDLMTQTRILLSRVALVMRRRRKQQIAPILRNALIGLFFGSIYYNLEDGPNCSSTAYTNRQALYFFTLIFMLMSMQEALPTVFAERLLYYRERGGRAYHVLPYWISTWLLRLPILAVANLTYCLCVYNLAGLNSKEGTFAIMFWTVLLFTYTTLFAIQGIAHLNGSQSGAIQYAPVYIFINVMFAGYILYIPDVQDWLSFGPVISPMRYAFQALLRAEFVGNDELPESDDYIEIMGFDDLTISGSIGILFIFFLITLFGSLAILWNVDHEQR